MRLSKLRQRTTRSRGFTLVEVMIATVVGAFVLGSLTMSLAQLAKAKDSSKTRLDAHLRADAALNELRRDIASVVRHDDLFWTRLLIRSGSIRTPVGDLDRDSILVFNHRLRAMHDMEFNGEGMEYETQYRIEEGDYGAMLWQRRDPVPDEYPLAGGTATPLVEGIVALRIEAYDGVQWFREWDSDFSGLPEAVRITLIASGGRNLTDLYESPLATLRTVVAIDRVLQPRDLFIPDEEEEQEEELEDVSDAPAGASPNRGERQRAVPGEPGAIPGDRQPGIREPGMREPGGDRRPGTAPGGDRRRERLPANRGPR